MVGGDAHLRPLPDNGAPGGGQQCQLVHRPFGAYLLHDADGGVGNGNEQEGGILIGSHKKQCRRQHHKNQIEEGENVLFDDFSFRLGRAVHGQVGPSPLLAQGGLFPVQPHLRIG